jgi:NAD(P)-dependent dehydrogenase (short-subunit alcohol dehydrogenase family)
MQLSLAGKVALVTGGSRGIGKGLARAFAEAGAKVMITSRKAESCAEAVKEIGRGAAFEAGNIGRVEDAERVIGATLERFGGLDILVNNAATNPYAGPTIDVPLPAWEKTLQVNLTAPLFWTQLAWQRRMKGTAGGDQHLERAPRDEPDPGRLRRHQGGADPPDQAARGRARAEGARERDRAGPDQDRLRAGALGEGAR